MINQSVNPIVLSFDERKVLIASKVWEGNMWTKPPNNNVKAIIEKLKHQLNTTQSRCAYCGLKVGGTSRGYVEHIAPKASYRHPQFTFTRMNLVIACDYCNGFDKKGTTDTISTPHRLYQRCIFSIVHPYFDNPDDHYDWDDQQIEILISIRNNSPKAIRSLEIFKLDTPRMNELRAAQVRHEEFKAQYPLNQADENLLQQAIT